MRAAGAPASAKAKVVAPKPAITDASFKPTKQRKRSIVADDAVGVIDVVNRLMNRNKPKRADNVAFMQSVQPIQARVPPDRSTKVVTSLGDTVTAVSISEDERMFVGAGTGQVAHVYSTEHGQLLATFALEYGINAASFTRTCTGAKLVTGDFGGCISVFDVSNIEGVEALTADEAASRLMLKENHGSGIVAIALPREVCRRTRSAARETSRRCLHENMCPAVLLTRRHRRDATQDEDARALHFAVMGLDSTSVYSLTDDGTNGSGGLKLRRLCLVHPMGSVLATHPAALALDGKGRLLATGVEKVVELWFIDERAVSRVVRPEVSMLGDRT